MLHFNKHFHKNCEMSCSKEKLIDRMEGMWFWSCFCCVLLLIDSEWEPWITGVWFRKMWRKACQLHIFLSLEKTDCQLHTQTCQASPSATLHHASRETCFIMHNFIMLSPFVPSFPFLYLQLNPSHTSLCFFLNLSTTGLSPGRKMPSHRVPSH